jgi:hypothetical protein
MERLEAIMNDKKIMQDITKGKHAMLEPIILSMPLEL